MSEPTPREDGPTEVVETESGELIERLSGGHGHAAAGLAHRRRLALDAAGAWLFIWFVSGERLGVGALFGGFGIYTALAGAAGPCVLWLAGRAQGHTLGWFLVTAAKIALVMVAIVFFFILFATLIMAGGRARPGRAAGRRAHGRHGRRAEPGLGRGHLGRGSLDRSRPPGRARSLLLDQPG